ncbi:chitin synthase III catalytic subunit [Hysterangium stoloniferum]|nr:chitin synthase III catalytic subunit [Hysterangium stoloniferum]
MTVSFGDFSSLCHIVPSYPWCNLFYRQLQDNFPNITLTPPAIAGVGVNPSCAIPLMDTSQSPERLGNIANVVMCAVSVFVVAALIGLAWRRQAAVARVEMVVFLSMYLVTLPLQLLTTGSILRQGSQALVALTAVHAGVVAALFWTLLGCALVSMQVVEDGTLSSLVPLVVFILAFFGITTYISLDVALTITHSGTFGPSNPPLALHSIPIFVLTSMWPGIAALLYFGIMSYVVLGILREVRPLWYYVLAAVLFVLSQLDYFLLSKVICNASSGKVDGSFIATLLETLAVGVLVWGWKSITEDTWDDETYYG